MEIIRGLAAPTWSNFGVLALSTSEPQAGIPAHDNQMGPTQPAQIQQSFKCSSSLPNLTCKILSLLAFWESLSTRGITSCKNIGYFLTQICTTTFQRRMHMYLEKLRMSSLDTLQNGNWFLLEVRRNKPMGKPVCVECILVQPRWAAWLPNTCSIYSSTTIFSVWRL